MKVILYVEAVHYKKGRIVAGVQHHYVLPYTVSTFRTKYSFKRDLDCMQYKFRFNNEKKNTFYILYFIFYLVHVCQAYKARVWLMSKSNGTNKYGTHAKSKSNIYEKKRRDKRIQIKRENNNKRKILLDWPTVFCFYAGPSLLLLLFFFSTLGQIYISIHIIKCYLTDAFYQMYT